MKKLFTLLIVLSVATLAAAQNIVSGTVTGTGCLSISSQNSGTVGISVQNVTGQSAWSGTIQPQVAIGGDPAANTQVTPSTGGAAANTITANGVYYAASSGSTYFQVCGNTVTNNAQIKLFVAQYSKNFGGGGGSGSGTVSANNGSAGAVANYAAAGGSTTVGPDSLLTDNGTSLTYTGTGGIVSTTSGGLVAGANGGAAGVLSLKGSTSGTATLTAPAVAGTVTNAIASSNVLNGPAGSASAPTYGFSGTSEGMYSINASNLGWTVGSTLLMQLNSTNGQLNLPAGGVALSSSTANVTTMDTGITRSAAAVVAVGTTALGNETGFIRSANTCVLTADVVPTVNTATNICSFSLPAVAKNWAFHCDIPWAITAGSGTNTWGIGVNASQTPTATTNVTGKVYNATATSPTYTATALSASGTVSVVTGPTYTPGATIQTSSIDGVIAASGTAGTFAITVTAAGTTATAAAKSGAYCRLE